MKSILKKIATVFCTVLALDMISCQQEVEHVHTFSDTWSSDENSHWHDATCGHEEKSELESHVFSDWRTVTDPTEEDDGSKERNCLSCGYKETDLIFALEHNHNLMSEWSSDETSHWHAYDCGRPEHFADKAAHIEDSGTVTKEPTCTEKGTMVYKCTVCKKELRTEDIAAKGHSCGDWKTTDEKHWKECGVCGIKVEEADHIEDSGTVTKEPTCTEKGTMVYKCTVCKKGLRTEDIAAKGHSFEDSGTVTKESTCTEKGTMVYKCTVCKKELRTEDIAAKGHSFGDWKTTVEKHWKECGVCGIKVEEAHKFIHKDNGWQKCESCDKKNSTPVSLDVLGTYDSTKMTFGVYPQTIKASGVTVYMTKKNTEITGADYYLGSDGAWYAECIENAYSTGNQYKYSDGNQVAQKEANRVKYFKVEPIEWVYLAETKCLHAKRILTANVVWDEEDNNYANSNIRSWLNGTFYNSAFTENQKKKIKTTTVDNSAASTEYSSNSHACENTNDNVYLLSYKEVTTTGNGFNAYADRIRFPTDYALANYCNKTSYGGWWWLRSPSDDSSGYVCNIFNAGRANGHSRVDTMDDGVVPALSISE